MSFNIRRCTHIRDDNSNARAVELNIEIGRFVFCLVIGL